MLLPMTYFLIIYLSYNMPDLLLQFTSSFLHSDTEVQYTRNQLNDVWNSSFFQS